MKDFCLNIASLPLGISKFDYLLNQVFFDDFNFEQDFENPELHVVLLVDKKNNMLNLKMNLQGNVNLLCDLTAKEFEQKLDFEMEILVKFGDFYDDTDDEILVLPHKQEELDLSQFFYDMTLLSIPQKRYHPDLGEEEREQTLSFLQESTTKTSGDPRWDALKKIKEQN